MKRTSKILVLVLSLALILGAVAMAVSAAATDVKLEKTNKFNTVSGIVRQGATKDIAIAEGPDGNKYAVITKTDESLTASPYANHTLARASISNGVLNKSAYEISNFKYMVYEIDVMSPTGKFMSANMDAYFATISNGKTSNGFWKSAATNQLVMFNHDANGSYVYINGNSATTKTYVNPYEFNHVQLIWENVSTNVDGVYTPLLKAHVYLNGELWYVSGAEPSTTNTTVESYYNSEPHVAFYQPKFNFVSYGKNCAEDASLAIDNFNISTVPAGSEITVEDLVTYDKSAQPVGTYVAEFDGVKYDDIDDALAAAPVNGTVKIINNIPSLTVGKVVNVDVGEFSTEIKAAKGYTAVKEGNIYKLTGITTTKSEDAQNLSDDWGKVGGFETFGYSVGNNAFGTTSFGEDSTGNKYIVFEPVGGDVSKDVYPGTGYGGVGSSLNTTNGKYNRPHVSNGKLVYDGSVEFFPYFVQDFEIASPIGKFATLSLGVQGRYIDAAGKEQSWNASAPYIATDDNGSYISFNKSTKYIDPYEFTHITFIVEGVTTDTYCYANFYVYVNGEYLASSLIPANQKGKDYYNGIPHWTLDEIRFGLNGSKTERPGTSIAFDNMTSRIFTPEYAELGGLAEILKKKSDLSGWAYDLTNAAEKPIISVASIGDVEYTDMQAAIEAVKDGETIKVLRNILSSVVVNNPFSNVTIDKGDFALELVAGNGMELTSDGNVYTSKETKTKLFQYVKNAQTAYGVDTLADAIADADAGSTVKLLADVDVGGTTIAPGKKLTLDLNGYTIKALFEGEKGKTAVFNMNPGTYLTVTSSRYGAKIFNEGWNSATGVGAQGVFNWSSDDAILRINGNIDGKPALAIYTGCVVAAYGNASEYYIDGGMFVTVNGDMNGVFESRKAGRDAEVKNAIFYTQHGNGLFGYSGRCTALDDYGHINVDNCVIIGDLTNAGFVAPQTITVTNTYITGKINVSISSTYKTVSDGADKGKDNLPGTVTLGEGVYVGGTISGNVKTVDGYDLYDVNVTKEFTYDSHAWEKLDGYKFGDSSFNITAVTKEFTFKKAVCKTITATWKDANGEVLGTSKVGVGVEAAAPTNLKTTGVVVEGWLGYVPAEWNESLLVPADATEITFTAKADGATAIVPTVQLLLNIGLTTHFTYNMYIPVRPEGIELTGVTFAHSTNRLGNVSGTYTIANQKYNRTQAWPGLAGSLKDMPAGIKFTYEGVTYEVLTSVNMVKYCEYILDDVNDYGENAKILAANCANYIIKGNDLMSSADKITGSNVDKMVKLLADNASRVTQMPTEGVTIPDTAEISKYVSSAQLIVAAYGPSIRFNLTEAGKAATITLDAVDDATKTGYAEKGYIQTKNNINITTYNALKLTVTPAEGEKITITYNLPMYYLMLKAAGGTQAQLDLVSAMYAYLKAVDIY